MANITQPIFRVSSDTIRMPRYYHSRHLIGWLPARNSGGQRQREACPGGLLSALCGSRPQ